MVRRGNLYRQAYVQGKGMKIMDSNGGIYNHVSNRIQNSIRGQLEGAGMEEDDTVEVNAVLNRLSENRKTNTKQNSADLDIKHANNSKQIANILKSNPTALVAEGKEIPNASGFVDAVVSGVKPTQLVKKGKGVKATPSLSSLLSGGRANTLSKSSTTGKGLTRPGAGMFRPGDIRGAGIQII